MNNRRATIGDRGLKERCYDLVTADRKLFWEETKLRMELRKIDLSGLLKLCLLPEAGAK